VLETQHTPAPDQLRPQRRRGEATPPRPAISNAGLARLLQRLPTSAIHTGRRYRYLDSVTQRERVGVLRTSGGGWYTFDNDDATAGRARGSANVVAEVAAQPLAPTGQQPQHQQPTQDSEMTSDEGSESESSPEASMEEEPSSQEQWSFGAAMLEAAHQLGIQDHIVISVIIELTQRELNENKRWGTLDPMLRDPGSIASCMKTAGNLVELFVTGNVGASAKATRGNAQSMTATATSLCKTIRAEAANGLLVNITYGIHGFVVVCWGNHAELLQSFAGFEEPETLASNFSNPRTFDIDGVCQVLTGMAGPDEEARKEGQTGISGDPDLEPGAVLEDETNVWPNVEFQWLAYRIESPAELMKKVVARMEANLPRIPKKFRK
jgi:hypothetical protein